MKVDGRYVFIAMNNGITEKNCKKSEGAFLTVFCLLLYFVNGVNVGVPLYFAKH